MQGWLRQRAWNLLRALGEILEPEVVECPSEPVRHTGVILAVRGWTLQWSDRRRPVLASLLVPYRWEGPVVRTGRPSIEPGFFIFSPTEQPRPDFGFFALKPDEACAELRCCPELACVGTVSLFGRVIEHEFGYRAEAARVDAVWLVGRRLDRELWDRVEVIARGLEHRYRCQVSVCGAFEPAVREAARSVTDRPPRGPG